jgi:hypothetical protein
MSYKVKDVSVMGPCKVYHNVYRRYSLKPKLILGAFIAGSIILATVSTGCGRCGDRCGADTTHKSAEIARLNPNYPR